MKKLLIPLLLILAILAAYWVAYGVNPVKKLFSGSDTDTTAGTSATAAASVTSPGGNFKPAADPVKDANGFPLSIGSTGQYVANIQAALNTRFGSELVVDGIFGTKTAKALSAHGYNPDAIYWKHYYDIIGVKI